jgi:hypothetical protein
MFKHLFFIVSLLGVATVTKAQKQFLLAEGVAPFIYTLHKVAPKENFYSIGRLYNIGPKDIVALNHLSLDSALHLNQVIKIPLTTRNFLQGDEAYEEQRLWPVCYLSKANDNFTGVANSYNGVASNLLAKWNKSINPASIPANTKIIVGYLKNSSQWDSIRRVNTALTQSTPGSVIQKTATVAGKIEVTPLEGAAIRSTTVVKKKDNPISPTSVEPAKKTTVNSAQPSSTDSTKSATTKANTSVASKEVYEAKQSTSTAIPASNNSSAGAEVLPSVDFNGGVFKTDYLTQTNADKDFQSTTGLCTTLKSSSGWKDGKYYALIANITPGTILKVSYNKKSIYCKVLGPISESIQYNNVNVIISAAAAAELGMVEKLTNVDVFYPKSVAAVKY